MAPFSMTQATPASSPLPLTATVANLQELLEHSNALLERIMQQQQAQTALLRDLIKLLDGFSSGGASFAAYQIDPMTLAYLAITGPQIHRMLGNLPQDDVVELLKAAGPLSRRVLEELDAYRTHRSGLDYLEEQGALIDDPWAARARES
jgi:hypothetical protein